MNLIPRCLILTILCLFVQITNEELTTAQTMDTVSKTGKSNSKETNDYKEEKKKSTAQGKFDMKDFKVTKLKNHHYEGDHTESCLANFDPQKIEEVKKSIRNHEYVPADPLHVSDEDIKIANCLKNEGAEKKLTLTTKDAISENTEANVEKETTLNLDNSKTNFNKVEEALKEDPKKKEDTNNEHGRRDMEYQFDALDYYDDDLVFDNTTCPDKVVVIELQLGEVKRYDVECEMMTHWTGLINNGAQDMYFS